MSYADNDAAGGWGGYDNPGYSSEQDNPGSSGNGGYSSSADLHQQISTAYNELTPGDVTPEPTPNIFQRMKTAANDFMQGVDTSIPYSDRLDSYKNNAAAIRADWGEDVTKAYDDFFSENPAAAELREMAEYDRDNNIAGILSKGAVGSLFASPGTMAMGVGAGVVKSLFDRKSDYQKKAEEMGYTGEELTSIVDAALQGDKKVRTAIAATPGFGEHGTEYSSSDVSGGLPVSSNPQINQMATMAQEAQDTGISNMSWEDKIKAYDMTSINSAMQAIKDVDTDITYQHTLADLSGIGMDANEKALLDSQKGIAIDRAITEIEDTFAPEGESIIAQQIHNLGTNALGGTIGQGFVKRWQEREAKAKTGALQDIESTYLAAERQGIDSAKQRQMDLWGKEYESDVKSAELGLDKSKSTAALQYDWDRSYLDRLAQMRGQDISAEQQNLDRLLKERMGNIEYDAWQDTQKSANLWGAVSGIGGGIAQSDWFGDVVSGWF